MSNSNLYYLVKIDHWDTLKAVYAEIQDIAETVRKEYRRKKKTMACMVIVRPIKRVISPLSMLINHRYSDDATLNLLSSAIKRIQGIAFELEQNYETRFVEKLRRLADTLIEFLGTAEGVQLELFDSAEYYDPTVTTRPLAQCFKDWLQNLPRKVGYYLNGYREQKPEPIFYQRFLNLAFY
ncbi:hypothetical protein IQ255_20180 [Pleurocapsales cyanobacterium LEGE 10410]|nr:hypothetical protein [Pleurocapsales cyanobacterium LEGE 10410]